MILNVLLDTEDDWEITDEDEEAYDDCDGTETGEMKEFCENDKGKRVSTRLTSRILKVINGSVLNYFRLIRLKQRFCSIEQVLWPWSRIKEK